MDIDFPEALELANEKLKTMAKNTDEQMMVLEDQTIIAPNGWLFFYNSTYFVQTGDYKYALAGNGPIFVSQRGTVHLLGTNDSNWENSIKQF